MNIEKKMTDYSGNLVGQIKQTEKSQQLSLDRSHPTVQGLMNLLGSAGRAFLKSYSNQIPLEGGADGFDKHLLIVSLCGQFIVMRVITIHYMTMMFPMTRSAWRFQLYFIAWCLHRLQN